MTKFRYRLSFIISIVVYLLLAFIYNSFLNIKKQVEEKSQQRVKISLIEQKIEKIKPTPKPTIKKAPTTHNITPIVPKNRTKKRYVKKRKREKISHKREHHKKIAHKKITHKKRVEHKEKIVKREIERRDYPTPTAVVEEYIEEPEIVEVYTPPPTPQIEEYIVKEPKRVERVVESSDSSEDLRREKREFLKRVRGNIYANKHYPTRAKRRRIEGVVHTVFDIEADGEATNIKTSNAPSILQRAVRKSIESSFPIDIPPNLIDKFPMRNISINIDFKLR